MQSLTILCLPPQLARPTWRISPYLHQESDHHHTCGEERRTQHVKSRTVAASASTLITCSGLHGSIDAWWAMVSSLMGTKWGKKKLNGWSASVRSALSYSRTPGHGSRLGFPHSGCPQVSSVHRLTHLGRGDTTRLGGRWCTIQHNAASRYTSWFIWTGLCQSDGEQMNTTWAWLNKLLEC